MVVNRLDAACTDAHARREASHPVTYRRVTSRNAFAAPLTKTTASNATHYPCRSWLILTLISVSFITFYVVRGIYNAIVVVQEADPTPGVFFRYLESQQSALY